MLARGRDLQVKSRVMTKFGIRGCEIGNSSLVCNFLSELIVSNSTCSEVLCSAELEIDRDYVNVNFLLQA